MRTASRVCDLGTSTPGEVVRSLLAGAWRAAPPVLRISAEQLAQAGPLLLASGAGALGWWRVRSTDLRSGPAASRLQQAYRLHALQSAIHLREIEETAVSLRSAGVDAVLVKGWTVARLYPEIGLRPYGDTDLCVRPEQYRTAQVVTDHPRGQRFSIDLHNGFTTLDNLSFDDLLARSERVRFGNATLAVLGLEDQLRLLCRHFLRHGAWRPLWLCDIAAAVESRPPNFDWDRCLGRNRTVANWVACAIGLAHELLGAELRDGPPVVTKQRLPRWLVARVRANWNAGPPTPILTDLTQLTPLQRPRELVDALRERWPDPIIATVYTNGRLNRCPRLPYQLAHGVSRLATFLISLPHLHQNAVHALRPSRQ